VSPEPSSTWSLRGLVRATLVGGLALGTGGALGFLVSHEPSPRAASSASPPSERPAAGPSELAVVAPLRQGAALADWRVDFVGAIGEAGAISIECSRGPARARLDVARVAPGAPDPPAIAGPYAIYYGTGAPPGEGERLARALAEVVAKNLAASVPPRLAPLRGGRSP
jgi:hypothetical protein